MIIAIEWVGHVFTCNHTKGVLFVWVNVIQLSWWGKVYGLYENQTFIILEKNRKKVSITSSNILVIKILLEGECLWGFFFVAELKRRVFKFCISILYLTRVFCSKKYFYLSLSLSSWDDQVECTKKTGQHFLFSIEKRKSQVLLFSCGW